MKVALVSLDQAWENKLLNAERCLTYVQQASVNGCNLIIFPEMTLTGFSMNSLEIAEDFEDSSTIAFFSDLALKYKLHILFGIALKNAPLPQNCALIISPEGVIISNYAKIHTFSYADEEKFFSDGNELSHCQIDKYHVGVTICYDLRFPELSQALSNKAEIIINIANWPASRIEHWDVLLRARAIENQVFMIGVNRTGVDGKSITYIKSSKIFNPNGEELKAILNDSELDIYEISLSQVEYFRTKFSFRQDRKTDLYKSIL